MLGDIGAGRAAERVGESLLQQRPEGGARLEDRTQAPPHVAQSKRQWVAVRRLVGPTPVSRCLRLHRLLCVLHLRTTSTSALLYRFLYVPSITRSPQSAALLDMTYARSCPSALFFRAQPVSGLWYVASFRSLFRCALMYRQPQNPSPLSRHKRPTFCTH